ncbi:ketopantoate reductase family protein [Paenibacillus marinisediminis]
MNGEMMDIVGAGAMGLLFASKILGASGSVRIWTRTEEQARMLREEGLFIELLDGSVTQYDKVQAHPLFEAPDRIRESDFKVDKLGLFVKQTHWTGEMLELLKQMPATAQRSTVCFQNGIGHIERLSTVIPREQLLTAVTTEAAKRVAPNRISHRGNGTTWIGSGVELTVNGVQSIAEWNNLLNEAGILTFVSNNIEEMVYQKLLINAVINPLTAILRIRNGELLLGDERVQLMRTVYEEVERIYAAIGIQLQEQQWQSIIQVCEKTAGNTSSMLADVLQQRSTEIEAITGELLKLADLHGLDVPVQRSLYLLIRALNPTEHSF